MRTLVLSIALTIALATVAYAGERRDVDCSKHFYKAFHNGCVIDNDGHEHGRDDASGVGVDVPLYKHEKLDIDAEIRFDTANGEKSYYAVVKPKMDKGIFQSVADFAKGLVGK